MTSNELLISAFKKVVSLPESKLRFGGISPLLVYCQVGDFKYHDIPALYSLKYKTMKIELTQEQYDELREYVIEYRNKSADLLVDDKIITELKKILK